MTNPRVYIVNNALFLLVFLMLSPDLLSAQIEVKRPNASTEQLSAAEILGRPEFAAISYGGYRGKSRDEQPTIEQLKEDMLILSAMGVKILRTYNSQQYAHASNVLKAIKELHTAKPEFEMYVMLGAWIDCENAWTASPNHEAESQKNNAAEIAAAVNLAKQYPDIVKVIAVGNEAMVHWAASYFVRPEVILKWVNHLQDLKAQGQLSSELWITSSDNFASWGGGDASYHNDDLIALVKAVDFVSMHTYPFHDTHYDSAFWLGQGSNAETSTIEQTDAAMERAKDRAVLQYHAVKKFVHAISPNKPIHIGETGWASKDGSIYGNKGSKAADEYKAKRFYDAMRNWSDESKVSCFYFEAFDEPWKDPNSDSGSENHFGMINVDGQAKYALWSLVDKGVFNGLTRGGMEITKTHSGDESKLKRLTLAPPSKNEANPSVLSAVNEQMQLGRAVDVTNYVVLHPKLVVEKPNDSTSPSKPVKLNAWEGTCSISSVSGESVQVTTGNGPSWWGCGLEIQGDGKGENLSNFKSGNLNFEIRGSTNKSFTIGFQTGLYDAGNLVNCFDSFGPGEENLLTDKWTAHSIPISKLNKNGDLSDVTSLLFLRSDSGDGNTIEIQNIYYSK